MKTKQQRIAELEAELAKLKAETERTPLGWKPSIGDTYVTLCSDGVDSRKFSGHKLDEVIFLRKPLYRTMEEAERADRIRKNKMEVLRCIEKHNDGWKPDWEKDTPKYLLYLNYEVKKIDYCFTNRERPLPDAYYLRDMETMETVKKEMGNKILALFDMEEGEV